MLIDAHTHLFEKEVCENREDFFYDSNFKLLYESVRSKVADYDDIIRYKEQNKIDYILAYGFCWKKTRDCLRQNDFLLKSQLKSNNRIIPFASLGRDQKEPIPKQMQKIKRDGFKGVGELAFYKHGFQKKEQKFLREVLEEAAANNLIVSIHVSEPVGHNYTGKYSPEFEALINIIAENPETKIILAHWGGGLFFYELMPEINEQLKNVYYDTAATPFLYKKEIFKASQDILNKEKVILGTDFPLLPMKRYLPLMDDLKRDQLKKIKGINALKLLNL